jgi:hypothetical protein
MSHKEEFSYEGINMANFNSMGFSHMIFFLYENANNDKINGTSLIHHKKFVHPIQTSQFKRI